VDEDSKNQIVQVIAETIEQGWNYVTDCTLQDKVEIYERLMRYCSQQRNHYLRKAVDERMLNEKDNSGPGDFDA